MTRKEMAGTLRSAWGQINQIANAQESDAERHRIYAVANKIMAVADEIDPKEPQRRESLVDRVARIEEALLIHGIFG